VKTAAYVKLASMVCILAAAGVLSGCAAAKAVGDFFKTDEHRFFSPEKPVARPEHTAVTPILLSMGMGDPHEELVPNAAPPREGDWSYSDKDYVIGPTDILDISVLDLYQQGIETILRRQVSASGFIDLPLLDTRIKAEGLSQEQLKEAIKDAYRRAEILRDPAVAISVAARRQSTFSVVGAVARPGTYNLIRRDMRLLEALATAGGLSQTNIRYLYVIRPKPAERLSAEGQGAAGAADDGEWTYSETHGWRLSGATTRPAAEAPARRAGSGPAARPSPPRPKADPYGWASVARAETARIIAVSVPRLEAGDPRMNIVIRDNDVIQVVPLQVGEFYVGGEVQRPGVYSLTGRRVTVKQAVTAAGNLAPLAWPENSVLVRRIGDNQEMRIALNIEAIFRGEEPDIYLKPNDVIEVGTSVRAPFWAVVRNAFRMTYGFGFVYDRNFADPLEATPTSKRFSRW
jgi:polysaccharide export outer membrane protein